MLAANHQEISVKFNKYPFELNKCLLAKFQSVIMNIQSCHSISSVMLAMQVAILVAKTFPALETPMVGVGEGAVWRDPMDLPMSTHTYFIRRLKLVKI